MSEYKNKYDFISRTQKILEQYDKSSIEMKYEKTLFMNCCIGLLVVPQQWNDKNDPTIYNKISLSGQVDESDWGINSLDIKENVPQKGFGDLSIENIAYHFRNSLCHYHFEALAKDTEKIDTLCIEDYYPDNVTKTFEMTISFDNFIKFVRKYAEEKKTLIEALF